MKPLFIIHAEHAGDLTAKLMDRITRLSVVDVEGIESDTLELDIDDREGLIEIPRKGERLSLYLGYAEYTLRHMGDYVVDELGLRGPPCVLTLSAKGANMLSGIKAPRRDTTPGTTLGTLVGKMAERYGLEPEVDEAVHDLALPQLDQLGESDMALLGRIARDNDLTLKIDAYRLGLRRHAATILVETGLPVGDVLRIDGKDIKSYDWRGTSRTQYTAVRARYYDRKRSESVPVIVGEPGAGPVLDLRHDAKDADEALRLAQARSNQLARGTGTLSLDLQGYEYAQSGMAVQVRALRAGLDGAWVIEKVTHELNKSSGFTTKLECVHPGGARAREQANKNLDELFDEPGS